MTFPKYNKNKIEKLGLLCKITWTTVLLGLVA